MGFRAEGITEKYTGKNGKRMGTPNPKPPGTTALGGFHAPIYGQEEMGRGTAKKRAGKPCFAVNVKGEKVSCSLTFSPARF